MSDCVTRAEWSLLEEDGVMEVAEQVARKVARKYPATETEDMLQEAYVLLATRAGEYRGELDKGGEEFLSRALWGDLANRAETIQRRANRNTSYEDAMEHLAEFDSDEDELDAQDTQRQLDRYDSLCGPVEVRRA